MDAIDIAWAAGYLEGEGSFFPTHSGRARPYRYAAVTAASVDREPLARLQAEYGGWLSGAREHRTSANAKPCYTWRVKGRKARALMEAVFPLMSPRRKEQIIRTLEEGR